jgi:thiosulfate/3-mercaptopyruvate sulfurtransferase
MAMKTGAWAFALLLVLVAAPPLAAQDSPLKWPVPKITAEPSFPAILIGAGELGPALEAGGWIALDAREAGSYTAGHLPGAVPGWSAEEAVAGVRPLLAARGISGEETVVLYGADGKDREAVAGLFRLLRRAGCAGVRILDGGFAAWQAAGGAVETGPPSRQPAAAVRRPSRGDVDLTIDEIDGSYGQAGFELLDVRDARGWERWETPPIFAAGHIPYALPFDPRALLPEGGGWPDPAEVRRRMAAFGPRPGDPVHLDSTFVLYAEDALDPRLGLGYLLLNLAGFEARVYPGGWREWTAGGTRPVVRIVSAAELAVQLKREDPGLDQDRTPRGLALLDLREARDFAIGHLPGAQSLPYQFFADGFGKTIEKGWPGVDRTTLPLVLYCYGNDCVRSRKAGAQAARLGFRDVLWFRGGIQEWRAAAYPLLRSSLPSAARKPAPPGGEAARPEPSRDRRNRASAYPRR